MSRPDTDNLCEIPAVGFGCLIPGELRILALPGVGLAGGGVPWDVPRDVVPFELRLPKTPLWLLYERGSQRLVRFGRRESEG